uniref:Cytochrome P450 n=1 Tax=Megaselia scalaris TaxID=36166 RepID=T1GXF6_MEGSC
MSLTMLSVALIAIAAYLIYLYFTRNFDYWKKRGVKGPKPKLIFGNFKDSITEKRNVGYLIDDIYRNYKKSEDFVGVFNANFPQLLILNPELAKQITTSDFSSFADNEASEWTKSSKDLLIRYHPFVLTGQEWKNRRSELIPSVTPAKIKSYYPNHVDATDLMLKYTGEVVCDVVFGLEAGTFKTETCDFMKVSRKLVSDFYNELGKLFISSCFPILRGVFKINFIKDDTANFYRNISKLAIESRLKGNDRNDVLQFLINMQEKNNISHDQFVGNQLMFILDGYDTTAVITAHVLLC